MERFKKRAPVTPHPDQLSEKNIKGGYHKIFIDPSITPAMRLGIKTPALVSTNNLKTIGDYFDQKR